MKASNCNVFFADAENVMVVAFSFFALQNSVFNLRKVLLGRNWFIGREGFFRGKG
jgi:hypothetical protein